MEAEAERYITETIEEREQRINKLKDEIQAIKRRGFRDRIKIIGVTFVGRLLMIGGAVWIVASEAKRQAANPNPEAAAVARQVWEATEIGFQINATNRPDTRAIRVRIDTVNPNVEFSARTRTLRVQSDHPDFERYRELRVGQRLRFTQEGRAQSTIEPVPFQHLRLK